jgi:hypothetical protein
MKKIIAIPIPDLSLSALTIALKQLFERIR